MANFKRMAILFGWFLKLKSVSTSPYLLVTSFHIQKIASKKTLRFHLDLQIISLEVEQRWIRKRPNSWELVRSECEVAEVWAIMAILWEMSERDRTTTGSKLQKCQSTHLSANASNHASFGGSSLSHFQRKSQFPLLNAMLLRPRVLSISGQITSRSRAVSLCQKSFGAIIA